VVLDRFVDSSLAYQGAGRGLGVDAVAEVNRFATGGLRPDRTILLDVDPAVGRERQASRGTAPDRLEQEDAAFFTAVAEAYRELAAAEPERFRVVDAAPAPAVVLGEVLAAVEDLLPGQPQA
jgi:dTMP kinase